ncbi:MAG: GntR family transcriptional regulator, partial [Pseudomonadota bacterium]
MAELQTDTTSTAARGTLTEQALESLQKDILAGTLKPGARLGVTELANTYDIGTTPIREALSRLLSKNLIVATERRGFRVREMSYDDLRDITLTRFVIEREALRLSMIQGDDEWIALIVASLHR